MGKTRINGGVAGHGYPDPGYVKRALDELASNGIHLVPTASASVPAAQAPTAGASTPTPRAWFGSDTPVCFVCKEGILGVVCTFNGKPHHFGCGPESKPSSQPGSSFVRSSAPSSSHQAVAPGSAVHSATPQQQLSSAVV